MSLLYKNVKQLVYDIDEFIDTVEQGVLVFKEGVTNYLKGEKASFADKIERIDAPGFPVEVTNILGAGDAFAAGFLYGYVNDLGWYKAARMGNACGAIVVTKHGCANFMPTYEEVLAFVTDYGGLE